MRRYLKGDTVDTTTGAAKWCESWELRDESWLVSEWCEATTWLLLAVALFVDLAPEAPIYLYGFSRIIADNTSILPPSEYLITLSRASHCQRPHHRARVGWLGVLEVGRGEFLSTPFEDAPLSRLYNKKNEERLDIRGALLDIYLLGLPSSLLLGLFLSNSVVEGIESFPGMSVSLPMAYKHFS